MNLVLNKSRKARLLSYEKSLALSLKIELSSTDHQKATQYGLLDQFAYLKPKGIDNHGILGEIFIFLLDAIERLSEAERSKEDREVIYKDMIQGQSYLGKPEVIMELERKVKIAFKTFYERMNYIDLHYGQEICGEKDV